MKVKIFVYFLIILFVVGCSQSRLVRRSEEARPLKLGCRFNVLDSSDAKNSGPESKLASLRGDSLQAITMASQRKAERDVPLASWSTMKGMVYGTAIGCGVGVVIGAIVAAKDDILMLGDEAGEIRWEK